MVNMSFDWKKLEQKDRDALFKRSMVASIILLGLVVGCSAKFALSGEPRWGVAALFWLAAGAVTFWRTLRGHARDLRERNDNSSTQASGRRPTLVE